MILKKINLKKNKLGHTHKTYTHRGSYALFSRNSLNVLFIADSLVQIFLRRQLVLHDFFSVAKWHSGRSLFRNVSMLNDRANHKWIV